MRGEREQVEEEEKQSEERKQRMRSAVERHRSAVKEMMAERDRAGDEQYQKEREAKVAARSAKAAPKEGQAKPKVAAKPLWAMTAKEKEDFEEDEAEHLIDFAENLDFDKFVGDLEFRHGLEALKDRAGRCPPPLELAVFRLCVVRVAALMIVLRALGLEALVLVGRACWRCAMRRGDPRAGRLSGWPVTRSSTRGCFSPSRSEGGFGPDSALCALCVGSARGAWGWGSEVDLCFGVRSWLSGAMVAAVLRRGGALGRHHVATPVGERKLPWSRAGRSRLKGLCFILFTFVRSVPTLVCVLGSALGRRPRAASASPERRVRARERRVNGTRTSPLRRFSGTSASPQRRVRCASAALGRKRRNR